MYDKERMTLITLSKQLVNICENENLNYDENILPIKLTADCYIIYATPKSDKCVKHGDCEVQQYYALTGGETIKIVRT